MNRLLTGGGAICTHVDSLCSVVVVVFPSWRFEKSRTRSTSYCRNAGVIILSMGIAREALDGLIVTNEVGVKIFINRVKF